MSATDSQFSRRFLEQARRLSQPSADSAYWQHLFAQAKALGVALHTARQQLDTSHLEAPVDDSTLKLWEYGLLLPEEINSGQATQVVRWFIDQLRGARCSDPTQTLFRDGLALYAELVNDSSQPGSSLEEAG